MITTAVILAAGTGTRLRPHTHDKPKCLVDAGGMSLLERQLGSLQMNGFKKVFIVTGYCHKVIESWLSDHPQPMQVELIFNSSYAETNNIYSVYLLKDLIHEGFVLLEADLIYDTYALRHFRMGDRIALSEFDASIHHGTSAEIDSDHNLVQLITDRNHGTIPGRFKTVNITSFSTLTWDRFKSALHTEITAGNVSIFYEQVIRNLVKDGIIRLKAVDFTNIWWDEIDNQNDLDRVNSHFEAFNYAFEHQTQTPSFIVSD